MGSKLEKPIYDTNYCGFDDKFATSIMHGNPKGTKIDWGKLIPPYFTFGVIRWILSLVSLQEQVMPSPTLSTSSISGSFFSDTWHC